MNTILRAAILVALTTSLAQARDLGRDEAQRLRDAGTIQSFEALNAKALALHPGSSVEEAELDEVYGKYIYEIELRDPQGIVWELELDAVSGQLLKDHQDT
ncbi:Peptidase propeptide and YPEB domain-containing protein [Pseudomonas sp. ok272]|uniref:PepSY domain-containing protein n=1 Tax=unclassified Pseudomonas TaxID=196821 RepID=UPI0008D4AB5C|nr:MULTISPECIES: PepSY domain-containing protein [unclassified Pseudomonas]SEM69205.1 Peptidase propeptide and YPEB domain-containing protein [Pseudomonas sp. ok272]SFM57936.1 Peptidase propeptide and YPEB domain-containing protein [Pseudomonas sp. ok602]